MNKCSQDRSSWQVGAQSLDMEAAMARHEGLIHAFIRRQGGGEIGCEEALQAGRTGLWRALVKYARELDECFPGQDCLARDMGNGERSVRRWLRELERAGLISIKQRGQGKPNLYTVHLKASFWGKHRRG